MSYILDASALLASLHNETGFEVVDRLLPESAISTINLSEVIQKARQQGTLTETLVSNLQMAGVEIVDYTIEQAEMTAALWSITRPLGLSLADRACLALAQSRNAIAVTADRNWAEVSNIQIQIIR
ncbi:MAG: type II toxin-antitoxin system VapC family toxin [Coleofasciculaceae cyanobacterium SM2_1_6]|nr:type II toxin-antitoxin system VapC family toxin [Coleofasciculaceae cyanobacterium SM2_1_6]